MEITQTTKTGENIDRTSLADRIARWWRRCKAWIHNRVDPYESLKAERAGWPPSLVKACFDQFDYAVKLRSGEHWYVSEATFINKDWVHLRMAEYGRSPDMGGKPPHTFARGVDVRVDQIVWFADAPDGS